MDTIDKISINYMKDMIAYRHKFTMDEFDQDIFNTIYGNPLVRDLPRLVSLYGLYGRFIVGREKIYFAYGIDLKMIRGEFIECRGTVVPESLFNRCGFINLKEDFPGLLGLKCHVEEIKDPLTIVDSVMEDVNSIEFLVRMYRIHGISIPEFVAPYSGRLITDLLRQNTILENDNFVNNIPKMFLKTEQKQVLLDHAIWDFPIRPKKGRCGLLAFSAASDYAPKTESPQKLSRLHSNMAGWNASFQSKELAPFCYSMENFEREEIAFIIKELKKRNVPFYKRNLDLAVIMDGKKRAKNYAKLMNFSEEETRDLMDFGPLYAYHKNDIGMIEYLRYEYTKSLFTKEQLELGKELYYNQRKLQSVSESECATYLFFINSSKSLNRFRNFAEQNNIKYGYPDVPSLQPSSYEVGAYLIVRISDMPIVDYFLHDEKYNFATSHIHSLEPGNFDDNRALSENGYTVLTDSYTMMDRSHEFIRYPKSAVMKRGLIVDPERDLEKYYQENCPYEIDKKHDRLKVIEKNAISGLSREEFSKLLRASYSVDDE